MQYLVDTNVFLEILLSDPRMAMCEEFIAEQGGSIYISDFSINSIGVILYRLHSLPLFERFLRDLLPNAHIARLPEFSYSTVLRFIEEYGFDYDDAYQLAAAQEYQLTVATMDKDFKKLNDKYPILLL